MPDKTLYEQLAEQIGAGESRVIPRIFETLADEKEAALLLAAAPPATVDELAQRTGLAAAEIEPLIDPLFRKGLLFKSKKADAVRYYRVRHALQFHDSSAVAVDPPPKMLQLWKEFMDTEWNEFTKRFEGALPQSVLRVVPVNVVVEPTAQVLAFEDVTSMIDSARTVAVTKCSCRAVDGACGHAIDVCLQLDKAADYSIERGTGRLLTKPEAMRILEDCEAAGLVHVAENKQSLGHVICNCCSDCCINWASTRTGLGKFCAPSRFRAAIDADDCNGCELCIDRCFFDALHMNDSADLAVIDDRKCMGCGVCLVACPTAAIALEAHRPAEFVPAA